MKLFLIPFGALAFILLNPKGCESTPKPAPPPTSLATTKEILLDENATLPDVSPGDTLDFVLPNTPDGQKYWVRFKKVNPCDPGSPHKEYHGETSSSIELKHARCTVTRHNNADSAHIFVWHLEPASGGMIVPDNAIICRQC